MLEPKLNELLINNKLDESFSGADKYNERNITYLTDQVAVVETNYGSWNKIDLVYDSILDTRVRSIMFGREISLVKAYVLNSDEKLLKGPQAVIEYNEETPRGTRSKEHKVFISDLL